MWKKRRGGFRKTPWIGRNAPDLPPSRTGPDGKTRSAGILGIALISNENLNLGADSSLLVFRYLLVPAQAYVGQFLGTFKEYPPRMKAASFSLDRVMEMLNANENE